ncbi:protein of unknown function [Thermomonospora echinospora]|uniref:DUF4439 domain-containing protein n=1 Tax=Thermomonospora echinospora TaxID=1992 RepID=A0A1H6BMB9_9ACTN|nr:ferritin-like domain-containing protein [Thermomonospora echinospora]SEG61834.1 protein of unknown function [Thermomonospora echinospora]
MSRTVEALQAALAAEHAAVYGYGVVGAGLSGAGQETARLVMNAHRTRRDQLTAHLVQRRARPVAAAAAYRLPVRVTSAKTAAELAAVLEDRALAAHLALAGAEEADLRRYAALAMQEAMSRSVGWRRSAGGRAVPPAFPGLPQGAPAPRSRR